MNYDSIADLQRMAEAGKRANAARLLAEEAQREAQASLDLAREVHGRFSIVRFCQAVATEGLVRGAEAEVSQEACRRAGITHDPHRAMIDWAVMSRVLSVGTASSGGHLVGSPAMPAVDVLRPASRLVRLGATVVDAGRGNALIPRVAGAGGAAWLGENGTATSGEFTLGQIVCKPKTVGSYVEMSAQLRAQAPGVEALTARHIVGSVSAEMDKAFIAGTSADESVPLGIRYTTGATVGTGTTFSNTTAQAILKSVGDASVDDESVVFLANPDVRQVLAARASNGTGSPYLWSDNRLAGKPAYVSTNVGTGVMLAGDPTNLVVPLWGGIAVEANPYGQNFKSGILGVRCFVSCDLAVTQPAGWYVSVGIS